MSDAADSPEALRLIHAAAESAGVAEDSPEVLAPTLTDLGNGQRLVTAHGENLRYCFAWKKWLIWNGHRWTIDTTGEIYRLAKQVAQDIATRKVVGIAESDLFVWSLKSQSADKLESMIKMARSEPGIPVTEDQFDQDEWSLGTPNGVIDLKPRGQGEPRAFSEPRREDLNLKCAGAIYDPEAIAPEWTRFLYRIMDDDEEMIGFLQRAIGYSITASVKDRALFILHGVGANGKSTFLETIQAMLGDYATVTPVDTLLAKKFSSIPNDVAALRGARFVTASETEENARLDEAKIKGMTGGDTLTARFMRQEFFSFRPTFKIWLGTNHQPNIRAADKAIWDRIKLVPFRVRIPEADQDKELKAKLLAELPGILNWALEGLDAWHEAGLSAPATVLEAGAKYMAEQDRIGQFLEERCTTSGRTTQKALYIEYKRWCEELGEYVLSNNALTRRLKDRGDVEEWRSAKERGWLIGLQEQPLTAQSALANGGQLSEEQIKAASDAAADNDLFRT